MEKAKIKNIKDNVLEIKYKGKQYIINISEELSIKEESINTSLQDSPSNYEFLCHLRDEACLKRNKREREKDAVYSEVWLFYKKADSKISNEMASHKAISNAKYQSYLKKFQKAEYQANQLISICRAFESRERMLQTLSSNLRRQ